MYLCSILEVLSFAVSQDQFLRSSNLNYYRLTLSSEYLLAPGDEDIAIVTAEFFEVSVSQFAVGKKA